MKRAARALRYAWAAPASLAGLVFAFVAAGPRATARAAGGALEVGGGWLAACVSRLPRGLRFSAITFGHVIVGVDHLTLERARAHERVHVRQYERWGVLFFPLYLGSSLLELARGRDPYWSNCFEREAHAQSSTTEESP